MLKAIERKSNQEFKVERIEGGYQVYTTEGEKYKKLKESTFKKYFKLTGDTVEEKKHAAKPEAKAELTAEQHEKMVEKIRKTLALAKDNPSMEEGLAAALKAQKLMHKYNIHEEEVSLEEIKDEISSIFTQQKHDSHLKAWRKQLAVLVANNFRCKCYMSGKDVVFRGYTNDAQIALEVYLTLYKVGDKLARQSRKDEKESTGSSSGKGLYNSFIVGFLAGLKEGFNEQCTALTIVVPKEVEEEFEGFSANFKEGKATRLNCVDGELYMKGKAEGKKAVKARAIEGK